MGIADDFSRSEQERYSRHFVLPQFGPEAQRKLRQARVAVVGAGGLGAPVVSYLAAAGIGTLRIIDNDVVQLSNLQRQILFTVEDIGNNKAMCAQRRIGALNPEIQVEAKAVKIASYNALELLKGVDLIVDATDNFPTRYLLNDSSVLLNVPLVYGSIFRYEGQVSVFNHGGGPTYRDLFPEPPKPGTVPDCEEGGVLGVLPGIIGSVQANEVIKLITGIGEVLSGKLFLLDSLSMESRLVGLPKKRDHHIDKLIDYDQFCGVVSSGNGHMKEVTVQELKALMDKDANFQLIDVREPHEHDRGNIGGELIPMAQVPTNLTRIDSSKQVIVYCRSGARSGQVVRWLEQAHGITNAYNLKGGIIAWSREIDPSIRA